MQYVGQSGRSLKTRFHEYFIKMKMPKNWHFSVLPFTKQAIHLAKLKTENIIYDPNSSSKLNIKTRNWVKLDKMMAITFSFGF